MNSPGTTEPAPPWPTEREKEFELLLSEANHANKQIGSFLGTQTKLLGILFPLIGGIVAAVFAAEKSDALSAPNTAKALLTLSLIGSFGILQTAIIYGSTLVYMDYKNKVLGPRLKELLETDYKPFGMIESFRETGASDAVFFATYLAIIGLTVLNFGLLCYCLRLAICSSCYPTFANCSWGLVMAIGLGFAGVFGSFIAVLRLRGAMRKVGVINGKDVKRQDGA